MKRFYVFLLSILVCSMPAAYSFDKKLSMSELCVKAASMQTSFGEAQKTMGEIISRGGSLCQCYKDFVVPAEKEQVRKVLDDAGFDSSVIDTQFPVRATHANPGLVCKQGISDEQCAYFQQLVKNIIPARRIILRRDLNEHDDYVGAQIISGAIDLVDGKIIYKSIEEEAVVLGPAVSSVQKGSFLHEFEHLNQVDMAIRALLILDMEGIADRDRAVRAIRAYSRFYEKRADTLPAACTDAYALFAMVQSFPDHEHNETQELLSTHPSKKYRLANTGRIFALQQVQAEEEFKQAYTECAAAQKS